MAAEQDKEILDSIEDIIVNHYADDGHVYTRTELKEILDSVVEFVDTRKYGSTS